MSDRNAHRYPARAARLAAGFTLAAAAKRLGITPVYLAALERGGYHGFCFAQAERASRLYRARLEAFLPPPKPLPAEPGGPGDGARRRRTTAARVRASTRAVPRGTRK